MVGRVASENVFQIRLNELFAAANRRPTNRAVAKGLLAQGCRLSAPYLSQLRNGIRDNPSEEVVAALADYFAVSPGYFFTIPWSGDRTRAQASDTEIVERLDDLALKQLLLTANGLSGASLELLVDLATRFRTADHRRAVPADSPSYNRPFEAAVGPRRTTSEKVGLALTHP
ncbi:helix-turn-helix domain-containing protein [Rhodococcus sp. OK302]|uniref:helix-turn-helix domain-containing protein n=1 Tax=Rhodococcus sp. OK302 TaxID=1882769 RepID=UPI000B9409E3|nr:helix-turn-helix transcriptional regulator [Rhodococcus sp. OK302]OYD60817.1 helix-turn-helix protein [Rhodococcus sp. OK302]